MKYSFHIAILACVLFLSCRDSAKEKTTEADTAANGSNSSPPGILISYQYDGIYLVTLPGGTPRRLTDGYDPELAPDGSAVAFTSYDKNGARFISICDINTASRTVFSDVPGGNNFGPRWSPDGRRILFNHFADHVWLPAYTDAQGNDVTIIGRKHVGGYSSGLHSPCWGPDGESIFCHNLDTLFRFSRTGTVLWKRAFRDIMKQYADSVSASSASRMDCDPSGRKLLIGLESTDGPVGAAYTYDFENGSVARVGPRDYHIMEPAWLPDGNGIVFTGCPLDAKTRERILNFEDVNTGVYKAVFNGETIMIAKDGFSPSCAVAPAM